MKSSRYNYRFTIAFRKYDSQKLRFVPYSPYNGMLKDDVVPPTFDNNNIRYRIEYFVGWENRTTWFSPEKIWTNIGNKTALISATAENINELITPTDYADLLFDAYAATLLQNFKSIKKEEFDDLKAKIDQSIICSYSYPAPFSEQRYFGDDGAYEARRYKSDGSREVAVAISDMESFYNQHFNDG